MTLISSDFSRNVSDFGRFVTSHSDFNVFVTCYKMTKTQRTIGLRFATGSGLLLKVGQYGDKEDVMLFDCEVFSCFPEERETLFFGGDTVLRIKGIVQWAEGKWRPYDKYMEPINAFCRMMNGLSNKKQPITTKKSNQRAFRMIAADVLRALMWQQQDAKTPKYVRNMVLYHHSNAVRVRLLYDELLSSYQWMHCILKSKSGGILSFANVAIFFCHSDNITFIMPKDVEISQRQSSALIDDMVFTARMALDIKIRFVWPSAMPQSTKSEITNASNSLYGIGCRRHFDTNSVTFSTTDAIFSVDAQHLFRARIQKMIQQLIVQSDVESVEKNDSS